MASQVTMSQASILSLVLHRNRDITNSYSGTNINSQPHHHKPSTSGANWNADTTATIPGTNGAISAARWSCPDPADHCAVTKRHHTRPNSLTTGTSGARLTTGEKNDQLGHIIHGKVRVTIWRVRVRVRVMWVTIWYLNMNSLVLK